MQAHFKSGKLLSQSLIEKEKEIRRQRLIDTYTFVASSFCLTAAFYSTVAYLALPLPAQGRDKAGSLASYKSIAWPIKGDTALNDPDSGVQLLISIFKRVGGNQQIAANNEDKKQLLASNNLPQTTWFKSRHAESRDEDEAGFAQKKAAAQFGKDLSSQAAPDPALSIRPQFSKTRGDDNYVSSGQSQATTYSAGGASSASNAGQASGKLVSEKPYIREWYRGAKQLQLADNTPSSLDNRQESRRIVAADDQNAGGGQTTSLNSNMSGSNQGSDNVSGIIRPSEQPGLFKYVREYMKDAQPQLASEGQNAPAVSAPAQAGFGGATNGNIAQGPGRLRFAQIPAPQDGFNSLGSAANANPGHVAASESARGASKGDYRAKQMTLPVSARRGRLLAAAEPTIETDKITIKTKKAIPTRIAFLPPNAVHGIAGLPLGASIAETRAFFKTRGKTTTTQISGFQVMTLRDSEGIPLLQAYLREGTVEALRIFHSGYAPPQLGLGLGETLPTMKAKFGEPAFILEEPRSKNFDDAHAGAAPNIVAKNYCYPVSQVSFQLARTDASTPPQVMSMMIFRFL